MITSNNINTRYISFKAEPQPIGGAAFSPKREIKSMEEHHATKEKILRLNTSDKIGLGLKKYFVDIPGSVVRGLQGDKSVSFHEFLQMAAIPYYLGGAMLYNCFRQGGDLKLAKKQGVGVALYYTGMALGNKVIDSVVKMKYGLDLNMKYKNNNGQIHKVFESLDFTRWDLLTDKDWEKLGDDLGIPRDIVDRDTAIKSEVHKILVKARAWKLALGATFAAMGAGYIARNSNWEKLFGSKDSIKKAFQNVFNNQNSKPLIKRVGILKDKMVGAFKSEIVKPFVDAFKKLPGVKLGNIPTGKIAIGLLIGLPVLAIIDLLRTTNKNKIYLSKQEAMPIASNIAENEALRNNIKAEINKNKLNYEQLYSQLAQNQIQAPTVQSQAAVPANPTSPFAAFESYVRRRA